MGKDIIISCRECGFREEFADDGEDLPADIVITHGRETGHRLTVDRPEE